MLSIFYKNAFHTVKQIRYLRNRAPPKMCYPY